jgi:hypothetical protein
MLGLLNTIHKVVEGLLVEMFVLVEAQPKIFEVMLVEDCIENVEIFVVHALFHIKVSLLVNILRTGFKVVVCSFSIVQVDVLHGLHNMDFLMKVFMILAKLLLIPQSVPSMILILSWLLPMLLLLRFVLWLTFSTAGLALFFMSLFFFVMMFYFVLDFSTIDMVFLTSVSFGSVLWTFVLVLIASLRWSKFVIRLMSLSLLLVFFGSTDSHFGTL